jgi:hypothetical protein
VATISEIADIHKLTGSRFHKFADLGINSKHQVDLSGGKKNSVYTSVDCYVSGTYTGNDGKSMEIKQRYTVYVAYNRDTQMQAMTQVKQQIMDDFNREFPVFRIADVFIPEAKFIKPLGSDGLVEDASFYQGSDMFKAMSRIDVAQYKMQVEKDIYNRNIKNIKKRYGI